VEGVDGFFPPAPATRRGGDAGEDRQIPPHSDGGGDKKPGKRTTEAGGESSGTGDLHTLEVECWRIGGQVGIDPRNYSYRQLYFLAQGSRRRIAEQAMLVWATEMDIETYLETGKVFTAKKGIPDNPKIAEIEEQIRRDGGKLIFENIPGWVKGSE